MNMPRHKIMLVDDEKLVLSALERSLRREGYELIIISSALEALAYLRHDSNIDIIISDHRMPKMTGLELLIEVRRLFPNIVRMLLTGHAELNVAIDAINQGKLYRFIVKPWQDSELKEYIRHALQFKRAVNEARKAVEYVRKSYADNENRGIREHNPNCVPKFQDSKIITG
jgi:DNA-binding NtrC family response regulator